VVCCHRRHADIPLRLAPTKLRPREAARRQRLEGPANRIRGKNLQEVRGQVPSDAGSPLRQDAAPGGRCAGLRDGDRRARGDGEPRAVRPTQERRPSTGHNRQFPATQRGARAPSRPRARGPDAPFICPSRENRRADAASLPRTRRIPVALTGPAGWPRKRPEGACPRCRRRSRRSGVG
jgi:hypothetical protein